MIHETAFIHPKAHVEDATIGARTKVWQFASVIRGAKVGEDCNITSGVTLDGVTVGDRVIFGQNISIGPGFLIGNDVFFGPNVVLANDRWPRVSKEGFDLTKYSHGKYAVIIEDGASIGTNATILPGVIIGRGSIVAAGAVVTKTVAPGYIFKRDGTFKPVPDQWPERMRFVECTYT